MQPSIFKTVIKGRRTVRVSLEGHSAEIIGSNDLSCMLGEEVDVVVPLHRTADVSIR